MNFSIVSILIINGFGKAHSFSSNLENVARRVRNPSVRGTFIPQRRHDNYRSTIYMILERGKKDFDTDEKKQSLIVEDHKENYLSPKLLDSNNIFPWERSNTNQIKKDMGDLTCMLNEADTDEMPVQSRNALSLGQTVGIGASFAVLGVFFVFDAMGLRVNPSEVSNTVQTFFADPNTVLQSVADNVASMGPLGALYFGLFYTLAEVLAIPAIPLTASAGYLFGVKEGTAIVLLSASIASAIGFLLGRTFFRTYVEGILEDKPEFKRIDKAIGEQGFKMILLLRLAPIFPFSFSNYLYGVTSVKFWPYFFGTMIGFAPGTLAYVYSGEIGKALTVESSTAQPWYIYALGLVLFSGVLKVVTDVATGVIKSLEEDV